MVSWNVLRWLDDSVGDEFLSRSLPHQSEIALDDMGRKVILFNSEWMLQYFCEKNPAIKLFDTPPAAAALSKA